ncbi:MAG TPA: hypothetical protein VGM10_12975 [Actinocrinis sp.]|jgi:hypothetical protein
MQDLCPTVLLATFVQTDLPISGYELTALESGQEEYLATRLQQLCMNEFGFDYLPGLSASQVSLDARTIREIDSRRYGVSDPVAVSTYGYEMPSWTTGTSAPVALGSLPKPVRSVLLGTAGSYEGRPIPTGGCMAQVQQELEQMGINATVQQSGGQDVSDAVAGIRSNGFQRTQSDPRVLKVFARWSACMSAHGYSYATPIDAGADPRWSSPGPAGAAQIQTAEQDLACKQQVNVIGVEVAVESDYENTAIAQNAQAMSQAKAEVESTGAALAHAMSEYGH